MNDLDDVERQLDAASAAIKTLEHKLADSPCRTPIYVRVSGGFGEHIGWDLGEPNRWRLVWRDVDGSRRMLIETGWRERLTAARSLDRLADEVANHRERQ